MPQLAAAGNEWSAAPIATVAPPQMRSDSARRLGTLPTGHRVRVHAQSAPVDRRRSDGRFSTRNRQTTIPQRIHSMQAGRVGHQEREEWKEEGWKCVRRRGDGMTASSTHLPKRGSLSATAVVVDFRQRIATLQPLVLLDEQRWIMAFLAKRSAAIRRRPHLPPAAGRLRALTRRPL